MSESEVGPDNDDGGTLPLWVPPGNDDDAGDLLSVLSSPIGNDDELAAVLARRPRAKLPSVTLVLVALVVASAGFIGGVVTGKHYGGSNSRSGGAAAADRKSVV